METDEKKRGNLKGVTSDIVASRVRQLRQALRLDLAGLSTRLNEHGWPIPVAALSRLENGLRRIDVDDLMALSVALETSPDNLLFEPERVEGAFGTALPIGLLPVELEAWKDGKLALNPQSRLDFLEGKVEQMTTTLEKMMPPLQEMADAQERDGKDASSLFNLIATQTANNETNIRLFSERIDELRKVVEAKTNG